MPSRSSRPASSPAAPSSTIRPERTHRPGRRIECAPHALLDDQQRHSFVAHTPKGIEDEIDIFRRQPKRRLVNDEEARLRQQRTGNRELLLLPTRKQPGKTMVALAQDREAIPRAWRFRRIASILRAGRWRRQGSRGRSAGRRCDGLRAPTRFQRHNGLDGHAGDRPDSKKCCLSGLQHARDCKHGRRFSGSVRADKTDDLALAYAECQVAHRRDAAIADLDASTGAAIQAVPDRRR